MSVDDSTIKVAPKSKYLLKRSASSIGFGSLASPNSNLRVTKSYTGIMGLKLNTKESKGTQMTESGNCGELLCRDEIDMPDEKIIETLDLFTNELMCFKESVLNYQGNRYLLKDISNKWKKDCRMWLWKNKPEKRNIGDLCNVTFTTHA